MNRSINQFIKPQRFKHFPTILMHDRLNGLT